MRASVKAAKSSAENRGRCLPASPGTSGGSAKMVEDRLGKTRSAVVTAIRICFIISRCPPELLLGGTKIYEGPLHASPPGKGLTRTAQPQSASGNIRLMPTMFGFLQLFWVCSNDRQSTAIRRPSNRFLAGRIGCFRARAPSRRRGQEPFLYPAY